MNAHFFCSSPPSFFSSNRLLPSSSRFLVSSSLIPRRRRRNPHLRAPTCPTTPSEPCPSTPRANLEVSLDVDAALDRFHDFLDSGAEAFRDLRSSVRIDDCRRRIVFSCRRSSVLFAVNVVVWGVVMLLSARVLLWLSSRFRPSWGFGDWSVVRRDRSLGGREVVVGRKVKGSDLELKERSDARGSMVSPLSNNSVRRSSRNMPVKRRKGVERLPEWWPATVSFPLMSSEGMEDAQREATILARAITDKRMSGEDYKEDDIVQLRRICRTSGARVSFDTANARDSLYRTSIDFALSICGKVEKPNTPVQIDGEEIRKFLAGLAYDIGLDDNRAAILLLAAVAAKTRSCFLQAWVLEAQGKRAEALQELSKIYRIHHTFPPEDHSPEIEMVASSLRKNLKVEQRRHLLNLLGGLYGVDSYSTAAASLGLNVSHSEGKDHVMDPGNHH